ncbi:MAG: hypothetical protein JJ863_04355 [Deltaproteobacteria bacterium]|nr:hypothetical protein [Deltaproteobacteria bacterium]
MGELTIGGFSIGVFESVVATLVVAVAGTGVKLLLGLRGARPGWHQATAEDLMQSGRILVIDNQGEEELAHISQMRKRGFKVERWDRVIPGKAKTIGLSFDLLLLDNRDVTDDFGAESGLQAVKLLRRDNPWVPIFIFTSYEGDIPPSDKRQLTQMRVGLLPKMTPYADMEKVLIHALARAREQDYFLSILKDELRLGNPDQALSACTDKRSGSAALALEVSSPIDRSRAERVLHVARDVYHGKRWSKKSKS